ncbi:MAG: acyl-CoA thioesterase [Gammaproteobacteria bacterium]
MQTDKEPRGILSIRTIAMPANTNANGDIFGGWLVSLMDMGAQIEGQRHAHSRVVTVAIDGLVFIKPVYVGDTVCCYADLIKVGRTSMQFNMEVWTLAIQVKERTKVAEGKFTFVAIDENGKPQLVERE